MRSKYNNLLKYIYDYSEKTHRKETVNGLFRAILEPLIQNQRVEACAFIRIFDDKDKASSLKRLTFSGVQIYNFSDFSIDDNKKNCAIENIWDTTEFLVILAGRYSAALIWDYSDCEIKDSSKVCLLYNSRVVLDIAKLISDNSREDLNELLKKYMPDRRENRVMNKSIQTIADMLNDKNEEFIVSEHEKNSLENDDDTLKTAQIVKDKAKFIAHEIKNYLSIINLYSHIAQKRFKTVSADNEIIESIDNALNNINNASENISYLISDLRCMSTPFKTQINLKTLVEGAIELSKVKLEKNNVELNIDNIEDIIITADKVKIECAITNIIFNAIDANCTNIKIEANKNRILIKNDGEKIEKDIQDKIFEENFTTKEKGNGLGLAFCKKQMQIAGGDINLVSSDDKGTVFVIEFNK